MPSKDLTFRLFGEDVNASLALRNVAAEAEKSTKQIQNAFGSMPSVITGAFAVAGVASVKMAADFEDATGKLITGAGESEKNIELIRDGLLKLAPAVGIGPTALAKAMFLVESAGFHAADGLTVMKAAAEGAKIGGADATVVANALTTALTDYHIPAADAARVTSQLVATVASGKTSMAELAGALSAVAPQAASAGVSLSQMLGAMGTMTAQGQSAQESAQLLSSTISSLGNPTAVQTKTMAQMGLSSIDVAKNLGKDGLTGTFETLAASIMAHMGPSGLVLQSSFNESKVAAASALEMLGRLPKSLQHLGKEFLDNKIKQSDWTHALKGQDVLTSNLGKEFATTAKQANGFSESLKGGQGSAATFNGIMSDMTGGQANLKVGLALTGANLAIFKNNVKDISAAVPEAGGHVKGWAETSKDFSLQIEKASASIQVMGVKIGTALLPYLSSAMDIGTKWTESLSKNKPMLDLVLVSVGLLVGGLMALFVAQKVMEAQAILSRAAVFLLGGAAKINALAMYVFSGSLYANVTAMLASKAETITLAGMYAREMVAGIAKSIAATVAGTASTVAGTTASIAAKVALIAGSVAMGIATAAQWALNVAMDANPVGLIILGIAALVAGLVWFFTQTDLGKDVFKNAMVGITAAIGWIGAAFQNVIGWVAQNWPLLLGILGGPIGLAVSFILTHLDEISGAFSTVFGALGTIVGSGFASAIGFARRAINDVIDLVNGALGGINGVGAAFSAATGGQIHFHVDRIPHLATGGTYGAGGLALVGENGPEIVKLPGGATVYPNGTQMGGGGGGTTVNITVQGQYAGDQNALAKLVLTAVTNAARQGAIPRNAFRAV